MAQQLVFRMHANGVESGKKKTDKPVPTGKMNSIFSKFRTILRLPSSLSFKDGSQRRLVFDILSDSLQPDSPVGVVAAARAIANLLAPGPVPEPSQDMICLMGVFLEFSWQIPHDHPSLVKLVQILVRLSETGKTTGRQDKVDGLERNRRLHRLGYVLRELERRPYGEAESIESRDVSQWISHHAFIALVVAFGEKDLSQFGLWMLHDALETGQPNDADVAAAAQWILHAGQILFRLVQIPSLQSGSGGGGGISAPGELFRGQNGFSLDRWRFWRDGFNGVAGRCDAHPRARRLAADAARLMDVLELTAPIRVRGV